MESDRRRLAVLVVPLIVALAAARQALPRVRAVDFLLAFGSGMIAGVTLFRIIQLLRTPTTPSHPTTGA